MEDEFRIYQVEINGLPHTFRLNREQAKERGLTDADLAKSPDPVKQSPAPANKKSPAPANKGK
jgi:hypothetical protein